MLGLNKKKRKGGLKIKGRIVRFDSFTWLHSFTVLLFILPSSSFDLYLHPLFISISFSPISSPAIFSSVVAPLVSPLPTFLIHGARGRAPVWIIISSHGRTAQLVIKIFRSSEWYYPRQAPCLVPFRRTSRRGNTAEGRTRKNGKSVEFLSIFEYSKDISGNRIFHYD